MFQLPPRTLANCTVLLIIKARKNKKDNALECFTETALYNSETEKTKLDIQERDISVEIQIEVVVLFHSFQIYRTCSKSGIRRMEQIRLANYIYICIT